VSPRAQLVIDRFVVSHYCTLLYEYVQQNKSNIMSADGTRNLLYISRSTNKMHNVKSISIDLELLNFNTAFPNIWGSPIFMPTPFNAERSLSVRQGSICGGCACLLGSAPFLSQGGVPQRSPILALPSIYVYTL